MNLYHSNIKKEIPYGTSYNNYLASNPSATASANFFDDTCTVITDGCVVTFGRCWIDVAVTNFSAARSAVEATSSKVTATFWSWAFCDESIQKQSRVEQHCYQQLKCFHSIG